MVRHGVPARQHGGDPGLLGAVRTQAGAHRMRLVLLWFGTWKNGNPHYMPEWMKLDPARYPYVVDKNGHPADSPSPFATTSLEADKKAFAALMRHLKAADPQRTVLMGGGENAPAPGATLRASPPAAKRLFDSPAPADILKAIQA